MNNKILMKKVIELDTQYLSSREQSLKTMVQIAIIRKAFGVKNDETNQIVKSYEREIVLSDSEITKQFKMYVGFWEVALARQNDKQLEYKRMIDYFIDGVRFFNSSLAETFEKIMIGEESK